MKKESNNIEIISTVSAGFIPYRNNDQLEAIKKFKTIEDVEIYMALNRYSHNCPCVEYRYENGVLEINC